MAFLVLPAAFRSAWRGVGLAPVGAVERCSRHRRLPSVAPRGCAREDVSQTASANAATVFEPSALSEVPKPSKKALKRAARMVLFQQLREERQQRTVELAAKQLRDREERMKLMSPERREDYLRGKAAAKEGKRRQKEEERVLLRERMQSSPTLVVDLELVKLDDLRWVRSLRKQLVYLYGANALAEPPFKLHLAGASEAVVQQCLDQIPGFEDWCCTVSDRSYLESFPHERLLYLSPDAEEELSAVEPSDVLVVGGIVDRLLLKGLTRGKADSQGLRSARLPLHLSPRAFSTSALPINHAAMAAIHFYETRDWRSAFYKALAFGAAEQQATP